MLGKSRALQRRGDHARIATASATSIAAACLAALGPPAAATQAGPPPSPETAATTQEAAPPGVEADLGADPLGPDPIVADELLLFADIPVVVTGSRTAQPITLASVPVSIVSDQDIKYGGFTNVAEALTFVPGMDVLRMDRNRYAAGVHGLHHEFGDRTLFLVNGRNAADPATGGADFLRLPLFMEDIERIEVVRGPGGAAWGANAFNGVVNVITKDPARTQGLLLSSQINHFGDVYNTLRYGGRAGATTYRLSLGYDQWETSEDATDNDHFDSTDFGRRRAADFTAVHEFSASTRLRFGVGYGNITRGSEEWLENFPTQNANLYTVRPFIRLEHDWDDKTSVYVQWFGNFDRSSRPGVYRTTNTENDLEAQFNFEPLAGHSVSIGGNARLTTVHSRDTDPEELAGPGSWTETLAGLFLIDRWHVNSRWTIEGQIRGDLYSGTHADWSGRLAVLHSLDDQHAHVLRAGLSKGFRAVGPFLRSTEGSYLEQFPGFHAVNIVGSDSLENEEVYAVDVGHAGEWGGGLGTKITAYYQRYEDLISTAAIPDPLGLGRPFFQMQNVDGADAYGVEAEAMLTGEFGQVGAWYAFNQLQGDRPQQSVRAFYPATHKVGATARWFIDKTWTANALFRYTSPTNNDGGMYDEAVAETYRVDLSLTARVLDGRGEVTLGVADLLDETDRPATFSATARDIETPGRTLFVHLRLTF